MKRTVFVLLTAFVFGSVCYVSHTHAQLFTPTNPEGLPPTESPNPFQPEEIPPDTLVAIVADMGIGKDAQAAFDLIKLEGADMAFIPGDLGYDNTNSYDETISRAKTWVKMKNTTLVDNGIPTFVIVGNHEVWPFLINTGSGFKVTTAWSEIYYPDYKKFIDDLEKKEGKNICNGIPGAKAACQYKGLFWVESGIKLVHLGEQVDYIKEQLAKNDSIWKLCTWHHNRTEMQLHRTSTKPHWTVPWSAYTACLNEGALIATGHMHSYHRTFTMNDLENESRTTKTASRFNNPSMRNSVEHVEDATSRAPSTSTNPSVAPATFVTVSGLGGESYGDQTRCKKTTEKCYNTWASVYAAPESKAAVFFIRFNPDGAGQRLAQFYLKDVYGKVVDSGWITSGNKGNFFNLGQTNKTPRIKDSQYFPPSCVDNYGVYSAMVGLPRPQQTRIWDHDQITCSSQALVGAGPLVIPQQITRNLYTDQDLGCDKFDGYMTNIECAINCQITNVECAHAPSKNKKFANVQWTPMDNLTTKKMDCQEIFGPQYVVVNVDFDREGQYRLKCAQLVNN